MNKAELKDVELRLIAELMKNCRRSDRELAKAIGVSQPTVSRFLSKLKKMGYFQEFVLIPNFQKLGYKIMALTFVKTKKGFKPETVEKALKIGEEIFQKGPFEMVMAERGTGFGHDAVTISYHQDYSSFRKFLEWIKQFDFLDLENLDAFLIDLEDKVHYRSLTFQTMAKHVLKLGSKQKFE